VTGTFSREAITAFMTPATPDLQTQLNTLRRDLKRQRIMNICLAAGAILAVSAERVVSQPAAPEDISVRTLRIVGVDGRPRVIISSDPTFNPAGGSIALMDNSGKARLGLMAATDGGSVALYRDDAEPVALLGADKGGGSLSIAPNSGNGRLSMYSLPGGMAINMVSNDEKKSVKIAAGDTSSALQFRGAHNQNYLLVGANGNGGVVAIFNKNGEMKRHLSALPGW